MNTTSEKSTPNKPSHIAYHVRDIADGKSFWTRIGSAWAHQDGKGFNIQLDVAPLDGRISLRVATEKQD
jgi:hypothetical protein